MAKIYDHLFPLFKLTGNNIRRHPVINLISILIITISLLLLILYFLGYSNAARLVSAWRTDLRIVVYLDEKIDEERMASLQNYCRELDEVVRFIYISRDQALKNFKVTLGDDANFLEGLPDNPLPASLELFLDEKVVDVEAVERLARQLRRQVGVDEVVYGSSWLRQLFSLLKTVKYFGFLFAAFLSGVTVFVVASTIRLSLFARRETIRVLHLVGATPGFIALPYLFEGVFQGSAASFLALGLAYGGFRYFKGWLQLQVPHWPVVLQLKFFSPLPLLLFLLMGTFLGIAGFLLSTRWIRQD
ncbi:MAG: ABC transporter permease [Deltaproteobacteria bacterium]|nr:ABC transporter permease [Deltaproteobacteria bacterium]